MKPMKFFKYIVSILTLTALYAAAAASPNPNDADTMNHIVNAHMGVIAMTEPVNKGTLLFSDSPEYPEESGILYGDKVSGDCRMYFYHVNQSNIPRKIVVVAYNPEDSDQEVILKNCQYAQPSTEYYEVGKELSMLYYEGNNTVNKVTVPAHGYALLGNRLDNVKVLPDQLFSGIVDIELPTAMYVSSMILPFTDNPLLFVRKQLYLPSDSVQLRGTFWGKDRYISTLIPYSSLDGIGYIRLAGDVLDRFLVGHDAMDNRVSKNVGNYGVNYTIRLRTKGTGNLHLYFNPMGGEYAGVMDLSYTDAQQKEVRKIIELPSDRLSMGKDNPYAMQYLDTVPAGTDVIMHMMPPGAANLPVRIIVVPDKELQKAADDAAAQRALQEKIRREAALAAKAKEVEKAQEMQSVQPTPGDKDTVSPETAVLQKDSKSKKKQEQPAKKAKAKRVYEPVMYGN